MAGLIRHAGANHRAHRVTVGPNQWTWMQSDVSGWTLVFLGELCTDGGLEFVYNFTRAEVRVVVHIHVNRSKQRSVRSKLNPGAARDPGSNGRDLTWWGEVSYADYDTSPYKNTENPFAVFKTPAHTLPPKGSIN